jgi:hypothetical protein
MPGARGLGMGGEKLLQSLGLLSSMYTFLSCCDADEPLQKGCGGLCEYL